MLEAAIGSALAVVLLGSFCWVLVMIALRMERYQPMPEDVWTGLDTATVYRYLPLRSPHTAAATDQPAPVSIDLQPRKQKDWDKPKAIYAYLGHQAKGAYLNHAPGKLSRKCRNSVIAFSGSQLTAAMTRNDIEWRPRDGALAIKKAVTV